MRWIKLFTIYLFRDASHMPIPQNRVILKLQLYRIDIFSFEIYGNSRVCESYKSRKSVGISDFMDIRTLCLGILTMGDASGYEIKKTFEERLGLMFHASYGSIYPALNKLTEEGLVSCRAFAQEKRPDKKIYSITSSGRYKFLNEIMKKPASDRFRSEFLVTLMFAHLLPAATIAELIDERILESQRKIESMNSDCADLPTDREQFLCGYGRAVYQAEIDYLQENRHLLEADALMGTRAAE